MNIIESVMAKPAWWFAGGCGALTLILAAEWLLPAAQAPSIVVTSASHQAAKGKAAVASAR